MTRVYHCAPWNNKLAQPMLGWHAYCGEELEYNNYGYPKEFMEIKDGEWFLHWKKCEECYSHTDLAMHLLGSIP